MKGAKKSSNLNRKSEAEPGSGALIARFSEAHKDSVTALAFLPLGRSLVSGSLDTLVHLWDVSTQKRIATHRKKKMQWGMIHLVASPNGNSVVSVSEGFRGADKGARQSFLWDLISGTKTEIGNVSDFFTAHCAPVFSASGDCVVFGGREVRRFDAVTGRQIGNPFPRGSCRAIAIAPLDQQIITGSADGEISIRGDMGEVQRTLMGHSACVCHLAFSPNGNWLASADTDGVIRIWNYQTGMEVRKWAGDWRAIESLSFLPDNTSLITGHDLGDTTVVRRWSVERDVEVSTWKPPVEWITTIAVCPTGKQIALGLPRNSSGFGPIEIWQLPSVLPAS